MYSGSYSSRRKSFNKPDLTGVVKLIGAVAVLVLFVLLVRYAISFFSGDRSPNAIATATLVQGEASMTLDNGFEVKLLQDKDESLFEDEVITTLSDSFIVIRMNGGSVVRIDESTNMTVDENNVSEREVESIYDITSGQAWFDIKPKNSERTFNTLIRTKRALVTSGEGRIAVSSDETMDSIRVFGGSAQVGVLDNESGKIIENYNVGVGQQIFVTAQVQKTLKIGQNPSLVTAIDDEYKLGTFYKWNSSFYSDPVNIPSIESGEPAEDSLGVDEGLVTVLSPADGTKVASSLLDVSGTFTRGRVVEISVNGKPASFDGETWTVRGVPVPRDGENTFEVEGKNPLGSVVYRNSFTVVKDLTPLPSPVITFPPQEKTIIATNRLELTGTVSPDTVDVEVNDYILRQYKPGQEDWTYKAIAGIENANMSYGLNTFTVFAIDEAGNKSAPSVVSVYVRRPNEEITFEQAFGSVAPTGLTADGKLNPPVILEPNGGRSFETSEPRNTLKGLAPEGTAKIQVNDFVLTRFNPGDKNWEYFAWAEYGTLKPGNNVYEVFAIDAGGQKSEAARIEINYQPGGVPSVDEARSVTGEVGR